MPDKSLVVALKIDADGKVAVREINGVEQSIGGMDDAARKSAQGAKDLGNGLDDASDSAKRADSELSALGKTLTAGAFLIAAKQAFDFSQAIAMAGDDVALLRLQAENLGGGVAGFDQLYASSQRLGIALQDAGDAANYFAPALAKLGLSYQDALEFNEDLVNSMRLYGVRGQQAASVTLQLGQALTSGNLAGDELRSLRESAGGLVAQLEEAVHQVTGTEGSLKELGAQGVLTSEVMIEAFGILFGDLEGRFEELPKTVEQQKTRMRNAFASLFSAIDERWKVSQFFQDIYGGIVDQVEQTAASLRGVSFVADRGSLESLRDQISAVEAEIAKLEKISRRLTGAERNRLQGLRAELDELRQQDPLEAYLKSLSDYEGALERLEGATQRNRKALKAQAEGYRKQAEEALKALEATYDYAEAADEAAKSATAMGAQIEASSIKAGETLKGVNSTLKSGVKQLIERLEVADLQVQITAGFETTGHSRNSKHYIGEAVDLDVLVSEQFAAAKEVIQRNAASLGLKILVEDEGTENAHFHVTRLTKAVGEAATAQKGLTKEQKVAKAAADELAGAYAAMAGRVNALVARYLPVEQAARDLVQAEQDLAAAVELGMGQITQAQADRILEQMREDMEGLTDEANELTIAMPSLGEVWHETVIDMAESMRGHLEDAWYDIFSGGLDSGKDFTDELGDLLIRGISQIAAQISSIPINVVLNGVLTSVTGAVGQQVGVAGAGGTGGVSGLGSLTNLVSGSSIGTAIADFGTWAAETWTNSFTLGLEGFLSGAANVPNWAFGIGGIGGGLLGANLFGDSDYGAIGSSIGSAAGTVIGASIAGPLGAIAGGILGGGGGGFLGSLFGSSETKPAFVRVVSSGGQLGIGEWRGVPSDAAAQIQEAIAATNEALNVLLGSFSAEAEAAARAQDSARRGGSPRYLGDVEEALYYEALGVLEAAASTGDDLAEAAEEAFKSFRGDFNAAMNAVAEEAAKIQLEPRIREALEQLGANFQGTLDELYQFLDLFGGVDAFFGARQNFLAGFYTEAERFEMALAGAQEQFEALGLEMPGLRHEFRELVETVGQDLSTDEAKELYAALLQLSGPMAALYTEMEQTIPVVEDMTDAFARARASIDEMMRDLDPTYAGGFDSVVDQALAEIDKILLEITGDAALTFERVFGEFNREHLQDFLLRLADVENVGVEFVEAIEAIWDLILRALEVSPGASRERLIEALTPDLSGVEAWELYAEAMQAWIGQIPASRAELLALVEAGVFTDDQIRILEAHLGELGLALDYVADQASKAIEAEYDLRRDAINDAYDQQQEAIADAYEQRRKALDAQREQLQEWVSDLNGIIGQLESARDLFAPTDTNVVQIQFEAARRQLAAIAASGRVPDADQLDRVVGGLEAGADERLFADAQQKLIADTLIAADLEQIQARAEKELTDAEKQLEALENQLDVLSDWRSAQLEQASEWRDAQLEQAANWRDRQLSLLTEIKEGLPPPNASGEDPGAAQAQRDAELLAQTAETTRQIQEMRVELQQLEERQVWYLKDISQAHDNWLNNGVKLDPTQFDSNTGDLMVLARL